MDQVKLMHLKDEIDQIDHSIAKESGVLQHLLKRLQDNGFSTVEDAQMAVEELDTKISKVKRQLNQITQHIDELLNI